MVSVAELKNINDEMWSAGNYPEVARLLADGAAALVGSLAIEPGTRMLDVATGNGNVALLAAIAGAEVTGVDLTEAYFGDARKRAEEAGVRIEFVQGDGEDLQFSDAAFDVVTSTYGIQFAPQHERVASELARVCRPGGTLGMCNWTPGGWTGRFQDIISLYFPDPPSYALPPMLWGDPDYVADLLGDKFEVTTERRTLSYEFTDAEAVIGFFENHFGPCLIAKQSISPRSRWTELRAELVAMTAEHFAGGDTRLQPEYLQVLGRRKDSR